MSRLDAYGDWLKIPQDRRGPDGRPLTHYDLLGLRPEDATPDRLSKAAMERSAEVRSYGVSPQAEAQQWLERLRAEIAGALICLSDPHKRQEYDREHLGSAGVGPDAEDQPAPQRALPAVSVEPVDRQRGRQSSKAEEFRLKRRLGAVLAAGALLLTAMTVITATRARRGEIAETSAEGPSSPIAQLDSEPEPRPSKPTVRPSREGPLRRLTKPPPASGAAGASAASGEGRREDSQRRLVVLTLPETVAEGDTVSLKAEVGPAAMRARCPVTIDWGDGAEPEEAEVTPSSTSPGSHTIAGRHMYVESGAWEVRVATRPDYGDTTIATRTVKVQNAPPKVTIKTCEARPGGLVSIEAVFIDRSEGDSHDVVIQWDDDTQETARPRPTLFRGEWAVAATHTYAEADDYTIAVTVVDRDKGSGESRRTVSVTRGSASSGVPQSPASARANPAGDERWFAIIVYEFELRDPLRMPHIRETALAHGKARANRKANALRRKYAADLQERGFQMRLIETDTREQADKAIEEFRRTPQAQSF